MRDTLGILLIFFALCIGVWYAYRPSQCGLFFCKWFMPWVYWKGWANDYVATAIHPDFGYFWATDGDATKACLQAERDGRLEGYKEAMQFLVGLPHTVRLVDTANSEHLTYFGPQTGIPWRMWDAPPPLPPGRIRPWLDHELLGLWLDHMSKDGWTLLSIEGDFTILQRPRKVYTVDGTPHPGFRNIGLNVYRTTPSSETGILSIGALTGTPNVSTPHPIHLGKLKG